MADMVKIDILLGAYSNLRREKAIKDFEMIIMFLPRSVHQKNRALYDVRGPRYSAVTVQTLKNVYTPTVFKN
jgi:hypothetical protein